MNIKEIDPITLKQWLQDGSAVLVDVREPGEAARERIEEAHHLPLSRFNPAELPFHEDKIVVYHCATGGRTAMLGGQLTEITNKAKEVYHLSGGIMGWKMVGHATC